MDKPPLFQRVSFDEATKRSEADGRWLIVDATAEWCGPCQRMDGSTWRDPEVLAWINANGLAIQVDVDAERDVAARIDIGAMPTIIAFQQGKEKDRIVGFREASALLRWLRGLERGETELDGLRPKGSEAEHDMQGRFRFAQTLLRTRRFDEATEEFAWLWENMARVDPAMIGVRVSFLAHDIRRLITSHASARQRFARFRDALEPEESFGTPLERRRDWIVLNFVLGEEARTLQWFDAIKDVPAAAPDIERHTHQLVTLLEQQQRWADIGRIYADPIAELRRIHEMPTPPSSDEAMSKMIAQHLQKALRDSAQLLVHCLKAAGRSADAAAVEKEALRLDPSDGMKQAISETPGTE
ncbi:MAG TPA: thioredoxin domain-containing protein [Polyangia bacterium]